jgi:phosphohistidine phosphatase SixA
MRDRLRGEARDILIAGHYPQLPRLLTLLLNAGSGPYVEATFPQNGVVVLTSEDGGETFSEEWRRDPRGGPTPV